MTDHALPDDELLSSYLDGELTAEEIARLDTRLRTDPELTERLEALRAATALASSPVIALGAADADRLIAAALASSTTAANVTDLAAAASRRRVWPTRMATVAAGVVALAIGVTALQAIDTGGTDSDDAGTADRDFETTVAADGADTAADMAVEEVALADEASGDSDDSSSDDGMADSDMDTGASPTSDLAVDVEAYFGADGAAAALFEAVEGFDPLVDDLGDFDTIVQLSETVSRDLTAFTASTEPTSTTTVAGSTDDLEPTEPVEVAARAIERLGFYGLGPCPTAVESIIDYFEPETVLAADYSTATIAGRPFTVGLFELTDDEAVLLVIDPATCQLRSAPLLP